MKQNNTKFDVDSIDNIDKKGIYKSDDDSYELDEIDYEIEDDNEDKEDTDEYTAEISSESFQKIDEIFSIYLKDIGKIPLLTPEQEIETAKKVKEGDKEAKQLMINSNLRLVVNIAKHYKVNGVDPMDLVQEGNQGLITAVERYDVDKGYRFSTYATWWIKQAITRYIMNNSRTIRIPVHAMETYSKIEKCRKKLEQEIYREPTVTEIAEHLHMEEDKVTQIINTMSDIRSLDAPINSDEDGDESTLGEFVSTDTWLSPEEQYYNTELHEVIMGILNEKKVDGNDRFNSREKEVIMRRFGFYGRTYTLEEVGQQMGVTRERIRQIESKVLKKLRMPNTSKKLEPFLNK